MPETLEQFYHECPMLLSYRSVLNEVVSSLVTEIRNDVSPHGVALEGEEPIAAYDWHVVDAYGKTPEEVAEISRAARSRTAPHQRLRIGLRLGYDPPDQPHAIASAQRCRQCVAAAAENGADAIFYYNYSESPRRYLSWIKPALKGFVRSEFGS